MKTIFTTVFFLLLGTMACAQSMKVQFAIDNEYFKTLDRTEKNLLLHQAVELQTFINETLIPKLPLLTLSPIKIKIFITTSDESRDGLFIPTGPKAEQVININYRRLSSPSITSLLAHEIFHAIHFEINPDEEDWTREGLAQVFEYIITNKLNGMNIYESTKWPFTSLTKPYNLSDTSRAQYGHDLLYFYYLYTHCGAEKIFWNLTKGNGHDSGAQLIDATLKLQHISAPECQSFKSSIRFFEIAKQHNHTSYEAGVENQSFYLINSNLDIFQPSFDNKAALKNLEEAPLFTSFKISLIQFLENKNKLDGFEAYYTQKKFPYLVLNVMPQETNDFDVVLVKME